MPVLNDVHSRLNPTSVRCVISPRDVAEVGAAMRNSVEGGHSISVGGGGHAMGGQQFGTATVHLDTRGMSKVLRFDAERGLLEIEAGADWPAIISATHRLQGERVQWGIRQKQTGADAMTLGGSIAANVHGRGLLMGPIVDDIEDLTVVMADGSIVRASRDREAELFSLVIGGYGLFGVVVAATLRLGKREPLRRVVDVIDLDDAMNAIHRRVGDGCVYGDFQYSIEPADDGFLRRGVMSCYKPVSEADAPSEELPGLARNDWLALLALAHRDKPRAFAEYARHYIGTHGRVYWSDTVQLSTYIPSYAEFLAESGVREAGSPDESLVIGEHSVPPARLMEFMERARGMLREHGVEDIYGTIRSIMRDQTTFMPWARSDYACVIFNLRTQHTPEGVARTHAAFRGLTEASIDLGGTFYLTYHRAATLKQVDRAFPTFREFLRLKLRYDPRELLQSDWYRHYRDMARDDV